MECYINQTVAISNFSYTVSFLKVEVLLGEFQSCDAECVIDYSLIDSNGNDYDHSVFTFDAVTRKLTVFTNDNSKSGVKDLKWVGTLRTNGNY